VSFTRIFLQTADGPLAVSIARADLRNPYVSLTAATHHDSIVGAGEKLREMADGVGAETGINGDYFDINDSGGPLNVLAIGGRIEHQGDGKAALVVSPGKRISMGVVTWTATLATQDGFSLPITGVNDWTLGANATLVTPLLGPLPAAGATCIVLDPGRDAATYRVAAVDRNLAALPQLRTNELAVAAAGGAAQTLADDFSAGDVVQLRQAVAIDSEDLAASDLDTAVGGGPLLLRAGRPFDDPNPPAAQESNQRYPVSGAGVSADGATLWLVVVDGRAPDVSIGITRPMLASLFASLGASDAVGFDTGGSAELVVRHLGDRTASVANLPSDGRERAIADGLFIVNSAPIGPVAQLIVRAPFRQVLAGSHLPLSVAAIDAHDQPLPIERGRISFSSDAPAVAAVANAGELAAIRSGSARVRASGYGVRGLLDVDVVATVATLRIARMARAVPVNSTRQLSVEAQSAGGDLIGVDASLVRWRLDGRGARLATGGVLTAGSAPARVRVDAAVGGARASEIIEIGRHERAIGLAPMRWRYASLPPGLPGGVDDTPAPDNSPALRLAYDFSMARGVRAAYAERSLILGGRPLAISLQIYGDGNGESLRGAYRNADGVVDTIAIARSIDWLGWRTVHVPIPAAAHYPITWLRFYAFVGRSDQTMRGSLWFRDLKAQYPGP